MPRALQCQVKSNLLSIKAKSLVSEKNEKPRQRLLIHFVNTDEALFAKSSRCSNSELKNCNFPNVELNFLPVTDCVDNS